MPSLVIERLPERYAIVRFDANAAIPAWAQNLLVPAPGREASTGRFVTVTRSDGELSIVAPAALVPAGVPGERDFALLRLRAPVPLDSVGVMASIAAPLAAAGVSFSTIATFDTDYFLLREANAEKGIRVLRDAGFAFE